MLYVSKNKYVCKVYIWKTDLSNLNRKKRYQPIDTGHVSLEIINVNKEQSHYLSFFPATYGVMKNPVAAKLIQNYEADCKIERREADGVYTFELTNKEAEVVIKRMKYIEKQVAQKQISYSLTNYPGQACYNCSGITEKILKNILSFGDPEASNPMTLAIFLRENKDRVKEIEETSDMKQALSQNLMYPKL